jgi:molybdopterin converting factor small subunit
MMVTIRLSAGLARLTGMPRIGIPVDDPATVARALERLADQYPSLASQVHQAVPVMRGEPVGREQILREGDELALLMPVAGG